jgi:hypothetical protein
MVTSSARCAACLDVAPGDFDRQHFDRRYGSRAWPGRHRFRRDKKLASTMEMWADQRFKTANDESLEPNDRRVKIDTKKWLMSKVAYRRYGDKLIHAGECCCARPLVPCKCSSFQPTEVAVGPSLWITY